MALHTQPTLDLLTIEGLVLGGYPGMTAGHALQLRAESWVQEMYADIHQELNGRKLKPMMVTSYGVTANGVSRYALPSDAISINEIKLLDGTHYGQAQASAVGSITLASSEDISQTDAEGSLILVISGTYVGNCSQISAYNTSTKVATVTPNFSASVTGTVYYLIIDWKRELTEKNVFDLDNSSSYNKGTPYYYEPIGQGNADSDETGEFNLDPIPQRTDRSSPYNIWGLELKYYANINLLDLTNDANLLLTLYRKWQNIIIQYVFYKTLLNDRKYTEARIERSEYEKLKGRMIAIETYGSGLSNLQARVET